MFQRTKTAEGNPYSCTWKKVGKGFKITVIGRLELQGEGSSFSEARAALAECILKATGDGEPVFQFDRALPKGVLPEEWSHPELFWISGNDRVHLDEPARLYEGGMCGTCGNPLGNRNAHPVTFSTCPNANSDGFEAAHVSTLFSDAFVALLAGMDGTTKAFRKVEWAGRKGRALFEIAGDPLAQTVVLNGSPVQGVQCARCKRKFFHQMIGGDLIPVLAAEDLPAPLPPWFFVRNQIQTILCMPGKIWRSIQGKPGTLNVVAVHVAVAPEAMVTRDPKLPLFKG